MDLFAEKLSRVAALRPRSGVPVVQHTGELRRNVDQLIRIVGGELCANKHGSHVRLRIRCPQPLADRIDERALARLVVSAGQKQIDELRDARKWLFLDTETTGLAGGAGTYAFLVGLGWWEDNAFVVEQFFMRDYGDEASLLCELKERLSEDRAIITFNGKSFDWPLLLTRFRMAGMAPPRTPIAHLDMLHPARRIWKQDLKSVALTQLEKCVLLIDRESDIPSETIPQRYFEFIRGGSPEAIAEIFHHNQMDICGLARLSLRICDILVDPENSECGGELFGLSRMLQQRGEESLAGRVYLKAIERGLTGDAAARARKELALMAKRAGKMDAANALWMELIDDSSEGLKAREQLAIYYEHHACAPETAASFSREALVKLRESLLSGKISNQKYQTLYSRFQHRLNRLKQKCEA